MTEKELRQRLLELKDKVAELNKSIDIVEEEVRGRIELAKKGIKKA